MATTSVDRRLMLSCRVLGVLAAFLFCFPTTIECRDGTAQRCLSGNGTEGTKGVNVTLTCKEGFAVSVEEASLSRNPVLCGRVAGDCSERIEVFSQECDGHRTCNVILRKTYTRNCGYATFLRVIYKCVPEIRLPEQKSTEDPAALRLTPEGQGQDQESQDSMTSPLTSTDAYPGPLTQPTTSPDDMALIVGCAVAVVITAIVLIVAIVLVVRRLCTSGARAGGEKHRGLGLFQGCADLGCMKAPPYPSTSGQTSATSANSAMESRLTPIGAPSIPSLVDPSPNPVSAVPVSVATVATAHAQPGPSMQHMQLVQHAQHVQHTQQANPMAPVPTVSASVRSSTRFDAVGLPNTETVSSC